MSNFDKMPESTQSTPEGTPEVTTTDGKLWYHHDTWYRSATEKLIEYRQKAEQHWYQCMRDGRGGRGCDPDQHIDRFYIPQERPAIRKTEELLALLAEMPMPSIPVGNLPDAREHKSLLMHIKLGLWLCTYFHGIPRIDLWEEVTEFSREFGAFPGDAFFYKYAGDIYRRERRQFARSTRANSSYLTFEGALEEGIIVMAFTPTILICDDHNFLSMARTIKLPQMRSSDEPYFSFLTEVTTLAHRYFRFQLLRYSSSKIITEEGVVQFPLLYGVAHWALRETIQNLAVDLTELYKACKSDANLEELIVKKDVVSALGELSPENLINKGKAAEIVGRAAKNIALDKYNSHSSDYYTSKYDALKNDADYTACLEYLKHRSNEISQLFFPSREKHRRLVIFGTNSIRRIGPTSSTISKTDGIAGTTFRPGNSEIYSCYWLDGLQLTVEREKLKTLWNELANHKDYVEFHDMKGREQMDFAEAWWQQQHEGLLAQPMRSSEVD